MFTPLNRNVKQTFLQTEKFPTMSQPFAILLAEQAVRQFFKQWNAGLQPCLLLETYGTKGGEFFPLFIIFFF